MARGLITMKEKDLSFPKEGFVRPDQVAHAFGVSRATIYNYIKEGIIPRPEKAGPRITRWPVAVIRECLARHGGSVFPPSHPDNQPTPAS
ncbi:MAG: AlpA family phage regulatory protein [Desulfovibrio desulfuricans]|nr:AlpA family phage regulatory protein [Desulfovibrio desulfuricans]